MNKVGKVVIAGLGIFGISKLFSAVQAYNVTEEMSINILNPRIIKADPNPISGGLEVGFELQLQNPTKGSLRVTQPYMQILSGKSVIAQSPVSQKEYTVKSLSELTLDTIKFKLGWLTIVSTLISKKYGIPTDLTLIQKVSWIINNYKSVVNTLDLSIRYTSYANGLFYEDIEKINY
jgi:hypothetical protein